VSWEFFNLLPYIALLILLKQSIYQSNLVLSSLSAQRTLSRQKLLHYFNRQHRSPTHTHETHDFLSDLFHFFNNLTTHSQFLFNR